MKKTATPTRSEHTVLKQLCEYIPPYLTKALSLQQIKDNQHHLGSFIRTHFYNLKKNIESRRSTLISCKKHPLWTTEI